jgi:hypothetical protein
MIWIRACPMEAREMAKRKRDFKSEYRQRIKLGLAKGRSRAQSRGHPKPSEAPVSQRRPGYPIEDVRLQLGLRLLQQGRPLTAVAKEIHVSPERLRNYGGRKGAIEKRGRRWFVRRGLPRKVLIFSDGKEIAITVGDFDAASLVGKYMAHVRWFQETNNIRHLKSFVGKSVTDIDGKSYLLETRPNVLYRLSHAGGSSFEQVYRIVV